MLSVLLLAVAAWIAIPAVQLSSGMERTASAETSVQHCVRAPSRACALQLVRALADTPGLLSATERESVEASVIYVDRPERLLTKGPPRIDVSADWPSIDRELFDALVSSNRFAEATVLLDQWIEQFKAHDSKIAFDVFVPALVRTRAAIDCLRTSVTQCAASLKTAFGAHAMHQVNLGTGESGPIESTAYLKLDRLLALLTSQGRLDHFLAVLTRAELKPGELMEAVSDAHPAETFSEVGLLRLGPDGRWADWRPVLMPFAELLVDTFARASDQERSEHVFGAEYLFWAHAATGTDMGALIAWHRADRKRISEPEKFCIFVSRSGLMGATPQLRAYVRELIRENESGARRGAGEPTFHSNERVRSLFCDEDTDEFMRALMRDAYASTHSDNSLQRLAFERRFPDGRAVEIIDELLASNAARLATLRGGWDYYIEADGPGPREAIRLLLPLRAFRTGEIEERTFLPDRERPALMAAQTNAIVLGHLFRGDDARAQEAFLRLDPQQRSGLVARSELRGGLGELFATASGEHYAAYYGLPPADPDKVVRLIAALPDSPEKVQLLAAWLRRSISRPHVIEDTN